MLGWALAVLGIVGLAVVTNRRVGLAVLVGCAIVLVMPFVIEVATYSSRGLSGWQGRYTLPFAVGLPLLAVAPTRPKLHEKRFVLPLAAAVVVLTVVAQYAVFKNAWGALVDPRWYVPLGDVLFGLGAVVVIAAVAWADRRWRRGSSTPVRPGVETER